MPAIEIKRLHAIISGRVQGVGFRWYTIEAAHGYKINGWVKNLYDGSVEVMAEGPREQLDLFLNRLWEGPNWSHVDSVHTEWLEPTGLTGGFDAKY